MHNPPSAWNSIVGVLGTAATVELSQINLWVGIFAGGATGLWMTICILRWIWSWPCWRRGVPPGTANLLALALLAPLLFGCASQPHQSTPVDGALLTMTVMPDGTKKLTVAQGQNPKTQSVFELGNGTMKYLMGTAFEPVITVPPAPDYAHYYVAAAGVVAMLGSGFLFYIGWPRVGRTVLLTGALILVIGLTVGEYGLLWAIAALVGGAVLVWHQLDGFEKGKLEGRAVA